MHYFLEHSSVMKSVWAFLDRFQDKFQRGLVYYEKVNIELDRYLKELAALEFSMNAEELAFFSHHLSLVNSELEREFMLCQEIERRNIDLPFEAGNLASVNDWLKSL